MAIVNKIPSISLPVVDMNKNINPTWWRFFRDFANETIESTNIPDLNAIEVLTGTGLLSRTGTETWALRTLTAGSSKLAITNPAGIAGNPTIDATEANFTLDNIGGTLGVTKGGTGLTTTTQGDLFYADVANSITKLAKNTTATRYLSNTGSSNNPAWAQVDVSNGITGTLPIANGGTAVTALPSFRATRTSNQTIGTAAFTKVQLSSETFDSNSNFDSVTNYRFTPTIAGTYQINAVITIAFSVGDTTTDWIVALYKNGVVYSQIEQHNVLASTDNAIALSDLINCNGSTDYIELFVYQAAGADRSLIGATNKTWMSGHWAGN